MSEPNRFRHIPYLFSSSVMKGAKAKGLHVPSFYLNNYICLCQ